MNNTDLIKRLRDTQPDEGVSSEDCRLCYEAADEIERLQALLVVNREFYDTTSQVLRKNIVMLEKYVPEDTIQLIAGDIISE